MKKSIGIVVALALAGGALWMSRPGAAEDREHPRGGAATPVPTSSSAEPTRPAGHSHERSQLHGGQVAMTREHHFETVLSGDGIRIYGYTHDQAPAMIEKAKGTATLVSKDGTKRDVPLVRTDPVEGESSVYFCPMHEQVVQKEPGVCTLCGGMKLYKQDYLFGKADLSEVEPGSMKALVHLTDLGGGEKEVTFTASFPTSEANGHGEPAGPGHGTGHEGHDH